MFFKKKLYCVTYAILGTERTFVVKASNIAQAMKIIQKKECYPISLVEYNVQYVGLISLLKRMAFVYSIRATLFLLPHSQHNMA